jgi:lambda repressor-like predicted transcriptional regulator
MNDSLYYNYLSTKNNNNTVNTLINNTDNNSDITSAENDNNQEVDMNNDIVNIKEYLKDCCHFKKITLMELASKSGLKKSTLYGAMQRNFFRLSLLESLATGLDSTLDIRFIDTETNTCLVRGKMNTDNVKDYILLCMVNRPTLSEAELARRSGFTPQVLNNKFKRNFFCLEDLEKLAKGLKTTVELHYIDKQWDVPLL